MARGGEGGEEGAEVLVQEAVAGDAPLEALEGGGVGQLAVDEQIGDLQEGGGLGQLVDGVAAVAQDPGPAVDVGDVRGARGGVGEALVAAFEIHVPKSTSFVQSVAIVPNVSLNILEGQVVVLYGES